MVSRRSRRHLQRRLLLAVLAVSMVAVGLLLQVRPVLAWTHEYNNFDSSGGTDYTCGGSSSLPCLYWAQGINSSITVNDYIHPSMYNINFDFRTVIPSVFSNFNGVAAYNPYNSYCYTYVGGGATQCGQGYYQESTSILACEGAQTDLTTSRRPSITPVSTSGMRCSTASRSASPSPPE